MTVKRLLTTSLLCTLTMTGYLHAAIVCTPASPAVSCAASAKYNAWAAKHSLSLLTRFTLTGVTDTGVPLPDDLTLAGIVDVKYSIPGVLSNATLKAISFINNSALVCFGPNSLQILFPALPTEADVQSALSVVYNNLEHHRSVCASFINPALTGAIGVLASSEYFDDGALTS